MRDIFINCLNKNIESHKNLILMVGDLGYSVIESFQKNYPSHFFNAGVAEQNMTGMAAGIASEGFHVFTYSIGNFNTFRCAEQIRNDIDYHNLNVTIVSVGGGLGYGALGYSHHAIQDYALLRSFPNMTIYSPGTNQQVQNCFEKILKNKSPAYFRLGKINDNLKFVESKKINEGHWVKISKSEINNSKKCILTTGGVIEDAIKMQNSKKYFDYHVYSLPIWGMKYKSLQPNQISKWNEIITLEDHIEDGGFGSYILECNALMENKTKIKVKALNQKVCGMVGSQDEIKNAIKFIN